MEGLVVTYSHHFGIITNSKAFLIHWILTSCVHSMATVDRCGQSQSKMPTDFFIPLDSKQIRKVDFVGN